MALISLRRLLDHAAENDYGVAAFNINNLEQFQAVMEAALQLEPVGQFVRDAGKATGRGGSKVVFAVPRENDRPAEIAFHNMLMRLCGLSYRVLAFPLAG